MRFRGEDATTHHPRPSDLATRPVPAQHFCRTSQPPRSLSPQHHLHVNSQKTYLRAPLLTASPSSSTHTLIKHSSCLTLNTMPTTRSDSSNWSPISANRVDSYKRGVMACCRRNVKRPPL